MSTTTQLLSAFDEDEFFSDASLVYDLREGVIWNPAKTRLCILSTDFLTGIYKGLVDEAGSGWQFVFYRCGVTWGERLAKRLDHECSTLLGRRMGDMTLDSFLNFITRYFTYHGWGAVTLHLENSRETGLVEATLKDSIFHQIVDDNEAMADPMISGILASMLGYLSGRKLDAIQTQCTTKGFQQSRFIIGAPERISGADLHIKNGKNHEELVNLL